MMSAYFTTDGGATWQESPDLGGTVYDVLERNETVYALWINGLGDYVRPSLHCRPNICLLSA
ncbi:MAG: hypothetical protein WA958_21190 [Tunicatimonas sp.]